MKTIPAPTSVAVQVQPLQPLVFMPAGRYGVARALKGRGAVSSPAHRFAAHALEADGDTWDHLVANEAPPTLPLQTTVTREHARSIISTNESPDIPFEQSINPYRGCEHGCVYCYARPSHSYLGLSPGLDFETQLSAKVNARELLQTQLGRASYKCSPIHLGANTDCYQPIEREWKITRQLIELLHEVQHPLTITTKSALIERDIDLLASMARKNLASVLISVTSLDSDLSRILEPRASAPWRRVETIKRLAEAGIPVGVSVAPLIPFVNEPELEKIMQACREAGAQFAHYTVVRMPWEIKDVFEDWLSVHFPDRAQRVMARIADMRGGKKNDPRFGARMKGEGLWADLIKMRFVASARKNGFSNDRPLLTTKLFTPPVRQYSSATPAPSAQFAQASLF
jgi:DNA repair photolyase